MMGECGNPDTRRWLVQDVISVILHYETYAVWKLRLCRGDQLVNFFVTTHVGRKSIVDPGLRKVGESR